MKNHDPQISDAALSALDIDTPMIEPTPQPESAKPAPQSEAPQAPAPAQLAEAPQIPVSEPAEPEPTPTPTAETTQTSIPEENTMQEDTAKKKHPALKVIGIVILVLMLAMIAFRLLALIAPDFIDSILYTEEELRLLGK